jgi:hypothetical protein
MLRMICFPPGTPAAAREALAAAVAALNTDKDHAAEAMSTIGFVPEWAVGPNVNQTVREVLTMPAAVRSFIADYIKAANK